MHQRIVEAETKCSQWLADGNAAHEAGNTEKAEKYYAKSQYWLDKLNKWNGRL
jgi:hypothetical protein